jgi:hypothetical protein
LFIGQESNFLKPNWNIKKQIESKKLSSTEFFDLAGKRGFDGVAAVDWHW